MSMYIHTRTPFYFVIKVHLFCVFLFYHIKMCSFPRWYSKFWSGLCERSVYAVPSMKCVFKFIVIDKFTICFSCASFFFWLWISINVRYQSIQLNFTFFYRNHHSIQLLYVACVRVHGELNETHTESERERKNKNFFFLLVSQLNPDEH